MTQTTTLEIPKRLFSVAEYHKLAETGILREEDRVELINGEIIEISPIGPKHAGNMGRLAQFLTLLFRENAIIRVQSPVQLGTYSEPEPDLAILKPREDFYTTSHPRPNEIMLLVEFADTSLSYDQKIKLPLYASHNIPETWLIDLLENRIMVFEHPKGEQYLNINTFQKGEAVQSTVLPEIVPVEKILGI